MGVKETAKDIAEKVGLTVEKGINVASDGVQKLREKSRLNREINQLNNEINDVFIAIGKEIYESDPESEKYGEVFAEVKDKQAKIDGLKRQLGLLDGMIICDACGETIPKDSKVCNKCGAEVKQPEPEEPEVVEAEEAKVCQVCGANLPADAVFCSKCGEKVE